MNELTHIATGAAVGAATRSPVGAALAGVVMHALMDVAPHREIHDRGFEIGSILVGMPLLALTCGPASPVFLGALGGVLPDLEHVLPRPLRSRRGWFVTHRYPRTHSSDTALAAPVWAQVALGGMALGWYCARGLLGRRRSA